MKKSLGFTLIEVLIALAILSISLTAIVKATSSDISNNDYLKNKALANLVAIEASELIKLNAISYRGSNAEQKTHLANKNWYWIASKQRTKNKSIYQVNISVNLEHKAILTKNVYLLELKN